jgi:hypothetical protein
VTNPAARPKSARNAGRSEPAKAAESNVVLVDGSNVAHFTEGDKPHLANILAVQAKLLEDGNEPVIIADAALRHQIDDPKRFEEMIESGAVKQAPAGTDADYFLLSFARELGAAVLSNDRFKDRLAQFPEARDSVIRFMIVNDEVVLERRARRRD